MSNENIIKPYSKSWKWEEVKGENLDSWTKLPAPELPGFVEILKKENKVFVYDLGCGMGRNLFYLIKQGFEVFGSDLSQFCVDSVNSKLKEINYVNEIKCESMTALTEKENSYDSLIAFHVVCHSFHCDLVKIMDKIYDILKPGGILFLTFLAKGDEPFTVEEVEPNTIIKRGGEEDGIPHHFVTREEINELLSKFIIEEITLKKREYQKLTKTSMHYYVYARKPE